MNKLMQLLEIAKKFGVKPSKVIGTQGNVVPMKKPTLVEVRVDEFKLKDSVDKGNISMDKVQQEMEETVKLALSKNLNDVELNRALNNAINLDRQFFPQSAEVVGIATKEPVVKEGIEQLLKDAGQTSPPGTLLGNLESRINKLKSLSKEGMTMDDILKDFASGQKGMARLEEEGLVRSTARQILINDIKAGKIKNISVEEAINMKEPIDPFRQIYGEGALEQLDSLIPNFKGLKTEMEAEQLARSKFKFEPDENRLPGSVSIEEGRKAEQEFGINKPKQTEIIDVEGEVVPFRKKNLEPEEKANGGRIGYADGTPMAGLVFNPGPWEGPWTGPEILGGPRKGQYYNNNQGLNILSVSPTANAMPGKVLKPEYRNGIPLGLLMDSYYMDAPITSESTTIDSIPLTLTERYKKYLSAAGSGTNDELYKSYRSNLDKKAKGGRIGYSKGNMAASSIDKLLEQLNKKSSKKKSMKSVNPKIGKINISKEVMDKVKEPTGVTVMDQEPIAIVDEVALEE
jgi:hypothetical protein